MLDAIVVGAGLSGLVCARRLADAGARIAVVEARDRVGGRLLTGSVGGMRVDLGGQWMTPGQPRLAQLACELGVGVEQHDRSGRALVDDRGGLLAAFAQWRIMRRIEKLMDDLDPELDHRSVAEWFAREVRHGVARERLALHADLIFATDQASLSLLHYLMTMKATSGFRPQSNEEYRFTGGSQTLALRLADRLGDRLRLGEAVTAIAQTDDSIAVETTRLYTAKRAVLAIPPPLVRNIKLELPPAARSYIAQAFNGAVVKCYAAYDRAYWRDRGLSGESYQPRGSVRATVELAPSSGGPAVLLAFIVGLQAKRWAMRDPDSRRAEVMAAFAPLCRAEPIDYLEVDWANDPWSAGCVPGLPPGALSAGARWRERHGRLHIAGTESATQWPGYMEGAIEAGERCASEVLAAL
ncbi:MAG TPA: FAD-dependent oxidoreductase [Kofleriaceae bacterium]